MRAIGHGQPFQLARSPPRQTAVGTNPQPVRAVEIEQLNSCARNLCANMESNYATAALLYRKCRRIR